MEPFEVIMIGNSAVGKTSMIAALANELDAYNLSGNVLLEPTTHEFKVIQDQWNEMRERVDAQKPFTTLSVGIEGTLLDFVEHKFEFKVEGKKQADVIFTDTRGGMTLEVDDTLKARVNGAFGIFCVVDASVLMECKPSTNERFNCPKHVKRLLREAYYDGDGKQPRFVAFVLTKCEKYLASPKERRELEVQFDEHYTNIIDMLRKAPVAPNVYVLAIQTMGCVSFFKLDENGLPEFRVLPKRELKTKDCAYPLVIMLQEIVNAITQAQQSGLPIVDWLLKLFGLRTDLQQYLGEIDANIEKPDFYKVL